MTRYDLWFYEDSKEKIHLILRTDNPKFESNIEILMKFIERFLEYKDEIPNEKPTHDET